MGPRVTLQAHPASAWALHSCPGPQLFSSEKWEQGVLRQLLCGGHSHSGPQWEGSQSRAASASHAPSPACWARLPGSRHCDVMLAGEELLGKVEQPRMNLQTLSRSLPTSGGRWKGPSLTQLRDLEVTQLRWCPWLRLSKRSPLGMFHLAEGTNAPWCCAWGPVRCRLADPPASTWIELSACRHFPRSFT